MEGTISSEVCERHRPIKEGLLGLYDEHHVYGRNPVQTRACRMSRDVGRIYASFKGTLSLCLELRRSLSVKGSRVFQTIMSSNQSRFSSPRRR